jgi:hypothetical protein
MSLKKAQLGVKKTVFNEMFAKHSQHPLVKPHFGKLQEGDLKGFSAPTQSELDELHQTVVKQFPPKRERSDAVSGRGNVNPSQPATESTYTIAFENDEEMFKLRDVLKQGHGECSVDVFAAEEVGAVAVKMSRPIGRIERDD